MPELLSSLMSIENHTDTEPAALPVPRPLAERSQPSETRDQVVDEESSDSSATGSTPTATALSNTPARPAPSLSIPHSSHTNVSSSTAAELVHQVDTSSPNTEVHANDLAANAQLEAETSGHGPSPSPATPLVTAIGSPRVMNSPTVEPFVSPFGP